MKDEPVAWLHIQGNHFEASDRQLFDDEIERGWEQKPLYTHPAKTITDEEIAQAKLEATTYKGIYDNQGNGIGQTKYVNDRLFVEAILRKAQEK